MPDIEKVIKGLNECIEHIRKNKFNKIPCWGNCQSAMIDAVAMLKEQEAVEPKQVGLYGNDEWLGLVCVCPDCKAEWMSDKADTHYCPKCGRSVKWE